MTRHRNAVSRCGTSSKRWKVTRDRSVFNLTVDDVPRHWYNVLADLDFGVADPQPADVGQSTSIRPQLPLSLYRQGLGRERFVEIPDPVRSEYQRWRPTPLYRARGLEQALQTPAHLYFKFEGTSPSGSHKLNTAIPQVYSYARAGVSEIVTGTGAGQWGSALAMACRPYGMTCTVFMVRCSYEQKPYRGTLMRLNGARVIVSPSQETEVGRTSRRADPDSPGSLGVANAEAIEYASGQQGARFSIGSGENHVLLHQTVIGEEALEQMRLAGEFPDVVVASMGAGSNFAGIAFPFLREGPVHGSRPRLVAVEPEACPKMTRGEYRYDHTDLSGTSPRVKMYTLGHRFAAEGIHAGGLRYHGAAPIVSAMYDRGLLEARSYAQNRVFECATTFAQAEGIVPAPESAHAIAGAVDEALEARRTGQKRVILFCLSGHGLLDLSAYEAYLAGELVDSAPSDDVIQASLDGLR